MAYGVFSHDVTAAILVSQNNETAAMLVSQTSPLGVELLSYANAFFCSNKKTPEGVHAGCVGVRKNYHYVEWQWKVEWCMQQMCAGETEMFC